jgi:hypothetical protein
MMTMNLAACGGNSTEPAHLAIAEAGPGTYDSGMLGDAHRLCGVNLVAPGKMQLAAEVRGLEGDAFWRLQVNGGLPSTGRVMPDGAGGAALQWEADVAAGDRVEVELFAVAGKRSTATWQSAALRAW